MKSENIAEIAKALRAASIETLKKFAATNKMINSNFMT